MFPAHAGMTPFGTHTGLHSRNVPRACGDDPQAVEDEAIKPVMFPAHAGMTPSLKSRAPPAPDVPRACGDDPGGEIPDGIGVGCSPRMRG